MTSTPATPQWSARQSYQWARDSRNAVAILEQQAPQYLPTGEAMDEDTANEIIDALASAKVALETAFGAFMLAHEREQATAQARYPQPTTGQPQYQQTGAPAWPQQ